MDVNDGKYLSDLADEVSNKLDIKDIKYVNKYDTYLIVLDDKYIYLINSDYELLLQKEISLVHENTNNYDIIYKNDYLMYFNDYIKDDTLIYEYYNINTYELIDRVFVGGNENEKHD